ncbi:MAG: alkaline phosphatase family protein [Thermoplasmata archaeon]|nr:alkaline phosphatase family protein [Thermoplasmata archaeon]
MPARRPGPTDRRDRSAAELAAPRAPLQLPRPAYDGRSIVNVSSTVFRRLRPDDDPEGLAPPLASDLDPWDRGTPTGTVVLLLVDGLGWNAFRGWTRGGGPNATAWDRLARPITTVFPSTTTTALVSLSSGTTPAQHGFVGYRQYLPRFGLVADMLHMSPAGLYLPESLTGPAFVPSDVSGSRSLFRRGLHAAAVSRDKFRTTGFTRVLYDGAEYVPYATATDLARALASVLTRPRPPPAVFAYWDELDTIQHLHGPDPAWIRFELDSFAELLARVARAIPAGRRRQTTLLITGDHGQVPTTPGARIRVEEEPTIVRELARPVAGDRRGNFFAARPGRLPALRTALEQRLPKGSRIVTVSDAVRSGLFGPPPYHPELSDRIGDLLALVQSPAAVTYRLPGAADPPRYLLGGHGGLEADELIVPLVAGTLDRFVRER